MRSIQIAKSLFLLLLAMSFALPAFAQSDVSAARGARKLRFASQRPVEHLRLQVHDAAGALIHVGTFKIDHPLDPENKYLYHSFVESPDSTTIPRQDRFSPACRPGSVRRWRLNLPE